MHWGKFITYSPGGEHISYWLEIEDNNTESAQRGGVQLARGLTLAGFTSHFLDLRLSKHPVEMTWTNEQVRDWIEQHKPITKEGE